MADTFPRLGVQISGAEPSDLLATIRQAEAAGVAQIWMTQGPIGTDSLTLYAAALAQTQRIILGTSIVPIYSRHPLTFAQQAFTLNSIAPGRIRLGIGASHRPTIESVYEISMDKPLSHTREYLTILRGALHQGQIDFNGDFVTAHAPQTRQADVPILISALGKKAYELAGQLSDGAISWNSPISYLLNHGLPILQSAADAAGRQRPPLIAQVWVSLNQNIDEAHTQLSQNIKGYLNLPFYLNMFAEAGYPQEPHGTPNNDLLDALLITGSEQQVADRLQQLLSSGLDELLISPVASQNPDELQRLYQVIGSIS